MNGSGQGAAADDWRSAMREADGEFEVANAAVRAVRERFDDADACVYLATGDDDRLELAAGDTTMAARRVVRASDDGWQDRHRTRPRRIEAARFLRPDTGSTEFVAGLAGRGVLAVAGPSSVDPDRIGLLAAAASAHLQRVADRSSRTTTDAVIGLFRAVNEGLNRVDARDEMERIVCERAVGIDPFEFAWIGEYDPETNRIAPRSRAGVGDGYLREISLSIADSPGERLLDAVITDGEVLTVPDVSGADVPEALTAAAADRGFRSMAFVPLVHGGDGYGLLAVYTGQADLFEPDCHELLGEIGATVAAAFRADRKRRALMTDQIVELEFRVADESIVTVWLASVADCRIEFESMVLASDGSLLAFLATPDGDPDVILDSAPEHPVVESIDLVNEDGSARMFKLRLDSEVIEYLAEVGAMLRSVTATGGRGTATVHLPADADVRSFVERIERDLDGVELVARRDGTRRERTPQELRGRLEEALTDRQHEVLQVAYRAGYFEWPRESDGESVAAMVGVSQPTFLQHLRTAERKLLQTVLDTERTIYSRE